MKRYINTKENLVMFAAPKNAELDCSAFVAQGVVFIGEDEQGLWYETEPFTGQIRTVDVEAVNSLFEQAEKIHAQYEQQSQQTSAQIRIEELHVLLRESDHKVLPDYDKPNETIKAQRQAWREEIRKLSG